MKKALITGISGQDGSYLAEYLLSLGYEVYGIVRRNSVCEHQQSRLDHIRNDIKVYYGDLLDISSLTRVIKEVQPDEVYNLAAQSHVRISFDVPQFTAQTNALGTLNVLQACKENCPDVRFYQASSSEMFGNSVDEDGYQRETTPMHPVSPYGCAKLFAYSIVRNYRKSYKMFAANGILFNHETVMEFMPMFVKYNEKEIDIKPICEVVDFVDKRKKEYQAKEIKNTKVWGKNGWTDVKCASAYPHDNIEDNKKPRMIVSRNGVYAATGNHVVFLENEEKKTSDIKIGDKIENIELPISNNTTTKVTKEEAELLGMMVGDGSITFAKKGTGVGGKFTNSNLLYRKKFSNLWNIVTQGNTKYNESRSGFKPENIVGQLRLNGNNNWLRKCNIYNKDHTKRVPKIILNSPKDVKLSFLEGYNLADGLKSKCTKTTYKFKNFKTNSPTLAMGLYYLIYTTTKQKITLNIEYNPKRKKHYYSLNLLSPCAYEGETKEKEIKKLLSKNLSQRKISTITGYSRDTIRKVQNNELLFTQSPLKKISNEVKKIFEMRDYEGWFYDLETTSGEFHCGVGELHVHNSPRRGSNFVTNKVVKGAVEIKTGKAEKLELGNMDSYRDWGHSRDYCRAMHAILNHDEPDDFVVATGKTHSVRDLCEYVFKRLDMNCDDYVVQNPKYMRPDELKYLKGDPAKIKSILGWESEITFESMLDEMIDFWLNEEK